MEAMATIAARLHRLEILEGENDRLRDFIERVGEAYEIADINELLLEAWAMTKNWS